MSLEHLLDHTLNADLAALRAHALSKHREDSVYTVPTIDAIDARQWIDHNDQEHWLEWRGRRTAARLREIPIEILPEESIVGRPELRDRTTDEEAERAGLQVVLDSIPPFPGGDPGHFQPDFDKLFDVGIGGVLDEVQVRLSAANSDESQHFYRGCEEALRGMSDYCVRVADECERLVAGGTLTADQELRMGESARICRRIADQPPETFAEAIQLQFLAIVSLWFGEDHGLTCPGRMDRTLGDFYERDRSQERITTVAALELICSLYIQLNLILYPGSAIAVMVGGRSDESTDVTNELTYLCLIARYVTRLVYPTVGLAWHKETPSELTDFACRMIARGTGDPALFNDELISVGLRDHGVSPVDSYNYMNSTCVEIKPVGSSHIWVTAPYFNCPQAVLDVIDGSVALSSGHPGSYTEFSDLVKARITEVVGDAATRLDGVWHEREVTGGFPLASCLIADCLEKGQDFDRGGARYNWVENSFVGLANLVDSLNVVKHFVYETGELSLGELQDMLQSDFAGQESFRRRIDSELPKYGNADATADALAVEWAEFLSDTTESNTVGLHRYVPGFFCWIIHEKFGSETGATPDGRPAGFPLADGAGAAQGKELNGPTASILSTTKWNHQRALGGLVHNLKLSDNLIDHEAGLQALRALIETYMQRGGFEIQVNVVNADELRDAQAHPDQYQDLLVRVAGYSDYFVHLNANMQEEVIKRTEHTL
jgi:trans-4-hydroxy-L-proline dehydratase